MGKRLKIGARVLAAALVGCAVGCSNAPVAGFLDTCFPSKARSDVAPNPGPSVLPKGDGGGTGPLPPKSDEKLPPPDFGANP